MVFLALDTQKQRDQIVFLKKWKEKKRIKAVTSVEYFRATIHFY